MTLRTYTKPNTIRKISKILLDQNMYIDGWTLQQWYNNTDIVRSITVCWSNRKLVGVFVSTDDDDDYVVNSGFYVIDSHRRRGIGSMLFAHNKCHKINRNYKYRFGSGISGSYTFLSKRACQVDCAEVLF
jgi:GNAT superfamily N-acetyltransferase